MRAPAAVCMMRQDAQSHDKRTARFLAHEEWTEMVQKRTASKQRFETWRGISVGHGANSLAGTQAVGDEPYTRDTKCGK